MLATSVNFLPAALGWENIPELVVLSVLHLLFINRVRLARAFAAAQRDKDLERFTQLKQEMQAGSVVEEGTGQTPGSL